MQPTDQSIPFPGVMARPVDASDTATDARLLAELAAGQSGALAELYRRRGGTLHGLLARMLGDDREAEEALQDTFVQLWRRARNYDAAKAGPFHNPNCAFPGLFNGCCDKLFKCRLGCSTSDCK